MTEHARIRARERYGIALSDKDILGIVQAIRSGRSVLLRRDPGPVVIERHLVRVGERVVIAVFKPATGAVVTILPPKGK